jgi:hypothetical protein
MNFQKMLMNMPNTQGRSWFPKSVSSKIPALYATEETPLAEKKLYVKFFTPASNWTWYGAEYNPEEKLFFGYVEGFEAEWGYFSLEELESLGGGCERDVHFTPCKFKDLK